MATIRGSVGRKGQNEKIDVAIVQKLLNKFQAHAKFAKLKVDGMNGPKTEKAIGAAQAFFGMKPDYRVDAGKNTIQKLSQNPKKVAAENEENKDAMAQKIAPVKGTWYKLKDISVKMSKVKPQLVNVVNMIGHHYRTKIVITSGYRDDNMQVAAMYNNWPNVKNLYKRIEAEPKVKKKLTELHAAKDFAAFKKHMKSTYGVPRSQHTFGNAVDIRKTTNSKVISALRSLLTEVREAHCYHFQLTKNLSDAQILKAKQKWK